MIHYDATKPIVILTNDEQSMVDEAGYLAQFNLDRDARVINFYCLPAGETPKSVMKKVFDWQRRGMIEDRIIDIKSTDMMLIELVKKIFGSN